MDCSLQVGSELPPQAKKIKVLFKRRKLDREMDRRICVAPAVMQALSWTVDEGAEPQFYLSIYIPIHTHGHKCWVVT